MKTKILGLILIVVALAVVNAHAQGSGEVAAERKGFSLLVPTSGSPESVTRVRSISYSSQSYSTSSTYEASPGSSSTSCKGTIDGTTPGGADIRGNCNTTYRSPKQGELTWNHVINYNVVEGGGYRFVISCTATFRWSKCGSLPPGYTWDVRIKGSQMLVTDYKKGKPTKKHTTYDIDGITIIDRPTGKVQ